jgi:arylsulfatase A-like enzyme
MADAGVQPEPRTIYVASRHGFALRHGHWKLVQPLAGEAELYNLALDPFETTDRSKADAGMAAELTALLAEQQARDPPDLPADLAEIPK